MSDRPPPTSYRDEDEHWHPGPGCSGYLEHVGDCRPCYRSLIMARHRGESWAIAGWSALKGPIAHRLSVAPAPTFLPGPGEGADSPLPSIARRVAEIEQEVGKLNAGLPWPWRRTTLVTASRSLPARWRQYASPGPLIALACGAAGALLLPTSVGAALVVLLLVAIAVIHRYVPDAVPVARARRGAR